ncbi:hypothetical protein [Streptomyces noursei]|uniref:hypothetical protein n=1 Tax=Streptomyces noursei TaxID=1971 RepID=UPI001673B3E3|nr:hypothetical protein [Streptomyces noursei]MCZ1020300.1 hypothetical protein [Streptomyces noursei]
MELAPHVARLSRALAVASTASGEEAEAFLQRFLPPLEASIRLTLLEVLSAAADEIASDLTPGSVDVRLRGNDPDFVVTPPPADPLADESSEAESAVPAALFTADEGTTSRITLRVPERLKTQVDEIAGREGLSANAWLVRAVAAAVELDGRQRRTGRRGLRIGEGYTGWSR